MDQDTTNDGEAAPRDDHQPDPQTASDAAGLSPDPAPCAGAQTSLGGAGVIYVGEKARCTAA